MNATLEAISRRQMLRILASIGVTASPFAYGSKLEPPMVAEIFFESYATVALRRARRYAGKDGFVASMPQLLHARVNAGFNNIIWNTWFTANSEESIVTTPQGTPVVVTIHGGGIFGSPERFERSLRADLNRANPEGLTGQYAARISEQEAMDVLAGRLPDGREVPVYSFDEFKRGIADLPMRYGIVTDFQRAQKANRGYTSFVDLGEDPIMITRAGGTEPLAAYLDKARLRNNTESMGNWHSHDRIDPSQPQTRILNLGGNKGGVGSEGKNPGLGWGYDADDGMAAGWPAGLARYVAVAPESDSTSLRNLDFSL